MTDNDRNHDNLYLMCNTKVDRVILENGRATAIRTLPMKPLDPNQLQEKIIKARKQIVISCGTLSTPLVLQRSGIGDPEKLQKAGVKCQVDLPGVGLNFQDHYLTFSAYRAKPDTESFDDFLRGDPETQKRVYDQWQLNGTGPLATNGIEAGVKVRPTDEELAQDYMKEFRSGWDSYFKMKPDKPVMHYSVISGSVHLALYRTIKQPHAKLRGSFFGDHMLMPQGKFFSMFHFLEYPFSRGSTHIVSPDPYEAPDFDAGFMNDERDMAPMVWGYIKSRETARRMDAYAGEVTDKHP